MLKKLLNYFNIGKHKPVDKYSIIISLKSNYDIDIELLYPDPKKLDISDIPDMAEKYANLMVYVGTSLLQNKVIDIVFDRSDDLKNSIKEKLFFDNIISLYGVLKEQIKSNKSRYSPLIRPINAFTTK